MSRIALTVGYSNARFVGTIFRFARFPILRTWVSQGLTDLVSAKPQQDRDGSSFVSCLGA